MARLPAMRTYGNRSIYSGYIIWHTNIEVGTSADSQIIQTAKDIGSYSHDILAICQNKNTCVPSLGNKLPTPNKEAK